MDVYVARQPIFDSTGKVIAGQSAYKQHVHELRLSRHLTLQ